MSQRKVMYQQQKHYNTSMDRFSDFKLGMASSFKRERACMAWATSSRNAFATATFSSFLVFTLGYVCQGKFNVIRPPDVSLEGLKFYP